MFNIVKNIIRSVCIYLSISPLRLPCSSEGKASRTGVAGPLRHRSYPMSAVSASGRCVRLVCQQDGTQRTLVAQLGAADEFIISDIWGVIACLPSLSGRCVPGCDEGY